jgi:hypothetical protein
VKCLVLAGADMTAEALCSAVKNGNLDIVKYLVESGIHSERITPALQESIKHKYVNIEHYLNSRYNV